MISQSAKLIPSMPLPCPCFTQPTRKPNDFTPYGEQQRTILPANAHEQA
jgi:hypothetical protein